MPTVVAPSRGSARHRRPWPAAASQPPASSEGAVKHVVLIAVVVGVPLLLAVIAIGTILVLRFRPQAGVPPQLPPPASAPGQTITPPVAPPTAAPTTDGFDETQARTVLGEWLRVKSNVFAPPFDEALLDSVVSAGPLWQDITKQGGSISWLKDNNRYYTYNKIEVVSVANFTPDLERPSIIATIAEDRVLHGPNGNEPGKSTDRYLYTFVKENGRWKIYDYKKL